MTSEKFNEVFEETVQKPTDNLRKCVVDDKPACFHRWEDKEQVIISFNYILKKDDFTKARNFYKETGVLPPGATSKTIRNTLAIVEYEDGTIGEVKPYRLRFIL